MENFPKFWKKAIRGSVGGRMLNKKGDPDEFLLKGDPRNPSVNTTVEILDAEAEKYFKNSNSTAIAQGYLVEVSEQTLSLDESNAVSDGYLKDLLKEPFGKFKSRVDKFTSAIPVSRLLEFAEKENKPVKTVEYLKRVIKSFAETPKSASEIDNVKIGSV